MNSSLIIVVQSETDNMQVFSFFFYLGKVDPG